MPARSLTFTESVELVTEACYHCGVIFAMARPFERERRRDHRVFYCPAGHGQHYTDETEEAKLRRELDYSQASLARAREALAREAKSHSATKGQLTKTRNRVQNGVCPDCNRHFTNLERHMATKHNPQTRQAGV